MRLSLIFIFENRLRCRRNLCISCPSLQKLCKKASRKHPRGNEGDRWHDNAGKNKRVIDTLENHVTMTVKWWHNQKYLRMLPGFCARRTYRLFKGSRCRCTASHFRVKIERCVTMLGSWGCWMFLRRRQIVKSIRFISPLYVLTYRSMSWE